MRWLFGFVHCLEVLFSMLFFTVRLILCQFIKCDFVVIFQDLCSKRMDLRSWLLCGYQSLEARDLTSVCKQSLIAKKDVNLAQFFVASWTVESLLL